MDTENSMPRALLPGGLTRVTRVSREEYATPSLFALLSIAVKVSFVTFFWQKRSLAVKNKEEGGLPTRSSEMSPPISHPSLFLSFFFYCPFFLIFHFVRSRRIKAVRTFTSRILYYTLKSSKSIREELLFGLLFTDKSFSRWHKIP